MRVIWWCVVLAACSKGAPADPPDPCVAELDKVAVILEPTLAGGDADAFHRASDSFQHATMCGPDLGEVLRLWEIDMRDPQRPRRRELLRRFDAVVKWD